MTFKKVKIKNMNEIIFVTYEKNAKKMIENLLKIYYLLFTVMTFARIFVNHENNLMYRDLFLHVFKCMKLKIDHRIQWKHLHEENFIVIIMNMNSK